MEVAITVWLVWGVTAGVFSSDRLARAPMVLLVSGVALLLTACSGDVSGKVYVTMKSGDVKRGADVEVVAVAASEQFESEWNRATAAFAQAYKEAVAGSTSTNWWEVREQHRDHAVELIKWGKVQIARTDVNGQYEMRGLRSGKYYVFAKHRVFDNNLFWMVPVEVKWGGQTINLSNSNAGWPFTAPGER